MNKRERPTNYRPALRTANSTPDTQRLFGISSFRNGVFRPKVNWPGIGTIRSMPCRPSRSTGTTISSADAALRRSTFRSFPCRRRLSRSRRRTWSSTRLGNCLFFFPSESIFALFTRKWTDFTHRRRCRRSAMLSCRGSCAFWPGQSRDNERLIRRTRDANSIDSRC